MAWVVVDAPKVDAGERPRRRSSPRRRRLAYVRFHGRNAGTWNVARRLGGAALRLPLRRGRAARVGAAAARARRTQAEEAYAFFNNNNQTNGVAQAPAGAQLLRKLLEEEKVPTA